MNVIETQPNLANVWNLKDQNIQYNIKWRKIKQARSYSNVTKKCNLFVGFVGEIFYFV